MKYLAAFLLWSTLAYGAVRPSAARRPMDRVRAYAGKHKVTVTVRNGIYWVEMENSDIFGTGPTVDEAAEDFMADVDLEAHETGRPYLTLRHGDPDHSFVCPPGSYCI